MRPRSSSGVSIWTTLDRKTAETTSAAPATARKTSASGKKKVDRPNRAIAAPHATTARTMPRPRRRTRDRPPERLMAMKAPAAGAAVRSPKPTGPTRKTSRASAGKTAVGMPKIIASRSIANVDRIRRLERTNWMPSRIAARPPRAGRRAVGSAGSRPACTGRTIRRDVGGECSAGSHRAHAASPRRRARSPTRG